MKQLYHSNIWYIRAYRLGRYARYFTTIAIWLLVVLFWWFCIHRPLLTTIKWYTQQEKIIHKQNRIFENIKPKIDLLQSKLDTLQNQRKQLITTGHVQDFHPSIQSLLQLAQQQKMSIESYIAGTTLVKDWYQKTGVSLQLQGTSQQLLTFLQELHKSNIPLSFKNVACNFSSPQNAKIDFQCAVIDVIA